MFRGGLSARLGPKFWQPTDDAPYIDIVDSRSAPMFVGMPTDFADPVYKAAITAGSARWSTFDEAITAINDAIVEPNRCQIVGPDRRLVRQSVSHAALPLYPSAFGYALRGRGKKLHEAVVYDGFASVNYYHHLIECLPTLSYLLDRSGLASDLPLIVNRWIYDSRFFAYLRQRSPAFRNLNWHIQEPGEYLRVERAYRIHAAPFERSAMGKIRALYEHMSEPKGRRVFLSRDSRMFSRGIDNEPEVASLLRSHGFEAVYAEHLTLEEQQRTFEECTHLVALQGMGLVQQFFMAPEQGHVLELMPSDRLQPEYYWQGWTLGMRFYDVQTGSCMDQNQRYHVELKRLEAGVLRMLDHPPTKRRYGETLLPDA